MKPYEIYCGGHFLQSNEPFSIYNSFNGEEVGRSWRAGSEIFDMAVDAAEKARVPLMNMPSWERSKILNYIAGELEREKEFFAAIICGEACKPMRLARLETERAVNVFRIAAEEARRHPSEYISLDWLPQGNGKEGLVRYFPAGIVAGISPFNFPLMLAVHKIAPAIAAGCPIVLKPASQTPLSTLALAQILSRSGLPAGAVSILPMNRETGNSLVTDPRFALLTFTGSPDVGWKMKQQAGKKKVVLELGGNAGAIVSPTSDLSTAVSKLVSGSFSYAGQVCIHTQRIFIHSSIFREFTASFIKQTGEIVCGDPRNDETFVSALIDEENAIRVEQWIQEAQQQGARLLCGGRRSGSFVEPSVLTNTRPDMKVCTDEVFGPVVVLEPYDDFEDAVGRVNHGRYGLQAGVFTNSILEMDYAFKHLEVGGVMINEPPTFRIDHMPYGGIKDSGLGREGIRYAMTEMMEPRILVK